METDTQKQRQIKKTRHTTTYKLTFCIGSLSYSLVHTWNDRRAITQKLGEGAARHRLGEGR